MCANLYEFHCRRCGECCRWAGHVYLTAEDISAMSEVLAVSEDEFIADFTQLGPNRKQLCLKMSSEEACIFLDGNSCEVYAARPIQCRDFPNSWKVPHGCPGSGEESEASF